MCLKVVDISGDGNCLFRAIADQLEGNEELHEIYRAKTINHIMKNKDHYKMFLDDDTEDIEEYIKYMSMNTIWGSQLEINALATVMGFNVIVH